MSPNGNAPDEPRPGLLHWPGALDGDTQRTLMADVSALLRRAPARRMTTPSGRPMSVAMSAAGRLGWITDRSGYRYEPAQPSGAPWPPLPASVLALWAAYSGDPVPPDSCLVNLYGQGTRMGLHRDEDEGDFSHPVLSISLGDEALFRYGTGAGRTPTRSLWLRSGDVLRMGGEARLAVHGIDRIRGGSSAVVPWGGRVNLTLRVVRPRP